jgi:hypothetical protein
LVKVEEEEELGRPGRASLFVGTMEVVVEEVGPEVVLLTPCFPSSDPCRLLSPLMMVVWARVSAVAGEVLLLLLYVEVVVEGVGVAVEACTREGMEWMAGGSPLPLVRWLFPVDTSFCKIAAARVEVRV